MSTLLNIDINNFGLQKMKEESGTGTMQSKEVTITTNGTTNVSADTGYAGLSNVEINTNVTPTLQNKELNITTNGTTTIQKDTGYDGLNEVQVNTEVRVVLADKTIFRQSQATNYDWLADADFSEMTTAKNMFHSNQYLLSMPNLYGTQNILTTESMFYSCIAMTSVGHFDTSSATDMHNMFSGCSALQDVPVYATGSARTLATMFVNCTSLTNQSLYNILEMCINADSITGTKTAKSLGLSSDQVATCQTLSNWNDFVSAGWSSGY